MEEEDDVIPTPYAVKCDKIILEPNVGRRSCWATIVQLQKKVMDTNGGGQ
jgi:hypothetical protein